MKKLLMVLLVLGLNLGFANELQKMDVPQNYGERVKFGGVIMQKPDGNLGEWIIGNKKIIVEDKTHFKGYKFEKGKYVEVRGFKDGDKLIAIEIEIY